MTTLRVAVYASSGLAVGFVKQVDDHAFHVEVLDANGFARDGGQYVSLLAATKVLLKAVDGED